MAVYSQRLEEFLSFKTLFIITCVIQQTHAWLLLLFTPFLEVWNWRSSGNPLTHPKASELESNCRVIITVLFVFLARPPLRNRFPSRTRPPTTGLSRGANEKGR